ATLVGAHDADARRHHDEQDEGEDCEDDGCGHGAPGGRGSVAAAEPGWGVEVTMTPVPRTSTTRTTTPGSTASSSEVSARHSSRPTRTIPRPWGPAWIAS